MTTTIRYLRGKTNEIDAHALGAALNHFLFLHAQPIPPLVSAPDITLDITYENTHNLLINLGVITQQYSGQATNFRAQHYGQWTILDWHVPPTLPDYFKGFGVFDPVQLHDFTPILTFARQHRASLGIQVPFPLFKSAHEKLKALTLRPAEDIPFSS